MAIAKPGELTTLLSGHKSQPRAILIHGADRSAVYDLCRQSLKKIVGTADDPLRVTQLTEAQAVSGPDRLYAAVSMVSMFGDKHVVWISDGGDGLTKILETLLAENTAGNTILVDSESLSKTSKLRKLFESHPQCVSVALYEESVNELRARLEKQVKSRGFLITADALQKLLEIVSSERTVGESETEKLMLYCHGNATIHVDDVEAICGDTAETSQDDLVDAVFGGKLLETDRYAEATSGGRSNLSIVLQHAVKLQAMAMLVAQNQSPESIAAMPRFGIFFKRRHIVATQLRQWDLDELLKAEEKICHAILQTRQHAALEEAIISRTLLALSRSVRGR